MAVYLPRVRSGTAIYDHLRAHLDPAGRLPAEVGLPDDDRVMTGQLRWVPGAMDGVMGRHGGTSDKGSRADRTAQLLVKACRRQAPRQLRALYEHVSNDDVLEYLDPMIERLIELGPERDSLRSVGRWLAVTGVDRGAVKVGIALLGVSGLGSDVAVVRTLGAHEEFTLYAAVAIANGLAEPESELWALAASVSGWGRIHCVERLRDTEDPQIQEWILREGFRNSIMYEYLAHIAATSGHLLEALRRPEVDRALLTSAGDILQALVVGNGAPAAGMDAYEDGVDAVEAYLVLIEARAQTLDDFMVVRALQTFLEGEDGWDARLAVGWTTSRREALAAACARILSRPEWAHRVAEGLQSDDSLQFYRASSAAEALGIDTFDAHLAKILDDPLESHWFAAWRLADDGRAEQLAELARTLLPLGQIATGPDQQLGLGPGWQPHQALDWTLQALRDHPGVGGDLLIVGLRSPVTRNRNMALNALNQWPVESWPPGVLEWIDPLAAADPNERTRELAADVLRRLRSDRVHD